MSMVIYLTGKFSETWIEAMDYQKIVALCMLCLLGCDVIVARPARRQKRSALPAIVSVDAPADGERNMIDGLLDDYQGLPADDNMEIGQDSLVLSRSRRSTMPFMAIALKQFCAKYGCRRSHHNHRRRHHRRRRYRHRHHHQYRLHKSR